MAGWLTRRLVTPCVLVTRAVAEGGEDEYGNPTYVETAVSSLCWLDPVGVSEDETGRLGRADFTAYLPPDVAGVLSSFAAIEVAPYGRLELVGPPQVFTRLGGAGPHHVEAQVAIETDT